MPFPKVVTSYTGPHSRSDSSSSVSYDYSGQDQHIKRQDEVGALRDAKFAANYSGDIPGAIGAANRIRDLLKAVRVHTPTATERDPVQMVNPLRRVASESQSSSTSASGEQWRGDNDATDIVPPNVPFQFPPQKPSQNPAQARARVRNLERGNLPSTAVNYTPEAMNRYSGYA